MSNQYEAPELMDLGDAGKITSVKQPPSAPVWRS